MALTPGTRLGSYEIRSQIGQGGMGVVYRATDTTLGRDVALKVLPEAVAQDADRLARFEREARTLASLNHPGIAAIYGFESSGGTRALVMELVEGPTLADRIALGPISLDEALPIAKQIAEALEAAHEQGIVHRDLKPANVKVRPDGTVKVLDFGLAKALEPASALGPSASQSMSPTLTTPAMTEAGMILGTAAYMSPEQARGQQVDARTDIWAFGVVLYEMLTGQALFGGDTVSDTLAGVLRADVDWSRLPTDVPTAVRRLLRRCLERDRRQRLYAAADARLELSERDEPGVASPASRGSWWTRFLWPAATLVLVIAAFAVGLSWTTPDALSAGWTGGPLGGPSVALGPRISPNGETLAFEAMVDGQTQVAIMNLQSGTWRILTTDRTSGLVRNMAWSLDGSSIYFDRFLDVPVGVYRIEVVADAPVPRRILEDAMAPEPMPDGSLVVVRLNDAGQRQLFRFDPETRDPRPLNGVLSDVTGRYSVRATRGGDALVFYGRPLDDPDGDDQLYELDLASGNARLLAASIAQLENAFPMTVSQDGRGVLAGIRAGNTNRLVSVSLDGDGDLRRLFEVTQGISELDVGPDGSVYLDQWMQPGEILIRDPTTGGTRRIVLPSSLRSASGAPLPLGNGRYLLVLEIAGRRRAMAISADGSYAPLLEGADETSWPAALVGSEMVALIRGSAPNQKLVLASIVDGGIRRTFDTIDVATIDALAGSPDGRKLYYAASGQVTEVEIETGQERPLHPGTRVAIDPLGQYAVITVADQGGLKLMKVFLADGRVEDIPNRSEFPLSENTLQSNAIARDGRIAVGIAPRDLWFWPTGVLDPETGQIEKAWPDIDNDMFAGWDPDGNLVALSYAFNSSLWRFVPEAAGAVP